MAQIGFIFEGEKHHYVVFVESTKISKDCVIGFQQHFDSSKIDSFYFLSKDLLLRNHIYLETARIPYGKIAVSKKNSLYFDDLTIWVKPALYKKLWEKLHLETINEEILISNTNTLIELLNL